MRPCCHGSRSRQRAHAPDPGISQHPRARLNRRARCHHVVNQDDDAVAEPASGRRPHHTQRQRVSRAHVGVPLRRGQAGLWRAVPPPAEDAPDRRAEAPGEVVRLIEAAPHRAPRMQRDGHDRVRASQQVAASLAHEGSQPRRQHPPAPVLERVNDSPQGVVVASGAPRKRHSRWTPPAPHAPRARDRGWQSIAAVHAARRCEARYGAPARRADRTVERTIEHVVAGQTDGCEQHADERVRGRDQHGASRSSRRSVQAGGQRDHAENLVPRQEVRRN
jgi:hypothetical protein